MTPPDPTLKEIADLLDVVLRGLRVVPADPTQEVEFRRVHPLVEAQISLLVEAADRLLNTPPAPPRRRGRPTALSRLRAARRRGEL